MIQVRRWILGLLLIALCLGAGTWISEASQLPVPGTIFGILLLITWIQLRGKVDPSLRTTSSGLLQHLSLLYIPAGVGLVKHQSLLGPYGMLVLLTLVLSTGLLLVASALLLRRFLPGGPSAETNGHPGRPAEP